MCAPVFQEFMEEAVAKFGGTDFRVPPGGRWVKIDRFTGAVLYDDATGDNVVAEYFRDGQDSQFGMAVVDGGFAMGSNLPLLA
jgi:penicillin-binding protein 1A